MKKSYADSLTFKMNFPQPHSLSLLAQNLELLLSCTLTLKTLKCPLHRTCAFQATIVFFIFSKVSFFGSKLMTFVIFICYHVFSINFWNATFAITKYLLVFPHHIDLKCEYHILAHFSMNTCIWIYCKFLLDTTLQFLISCS